MKKLAFGAIAAGALVAATAVPAIAQVGVYAGPGGIGVDIGASGYTTGPVRIIAATTIMRRDGTAT